jgi:hypothetical protein
MSAILLAAFALTKYLPFIRQVTAQILVSSSTTFIQNSAHSIWKNLSISNFLE